MAAATQARKKKKLTTPAKVLIIATAILLVAAILMGFLVYRKYASITADQNDMQKIFGASTSSGEVDDEGNSVVSIPEKIEKEDIDPETGVIPSFNELHAINPDIVGYVQIPGTKLNTAVAQGSDNEFYLYNSYKKQSAALGVPFVDYRATINPERQSENLTIYGHSAKDGSYFAALKNYKDVSYYKQHPVVLFDTIYGKGAYKVIGLFMENVNYQQNPSGKMFEYHNLYDMNETDFNDYIANVMKRSYFTTSVDVKYGDKLISLSTCDYDVNDHDYRIVLVAREVREDETTTVDTSAAAANSSMIMPAGWVSKYGKANPYK